jgi:hypothetical protein
MDVTDRLNGVAPRPLRSIVASDLLFLHANTAAR